MHLFFFSFFFFTASVPRRVALKKDIDVDVALYEAKGTAYHVRDLEKSNYLSEIQRSTVDGVGWNQVNSYLSRIVCGSAYETHT